MISISHVGKNAGEMHILKSSAYIFNAFDKHCTHADDLTLEWWRKISAYTVSFNRLCDRRIAYIICRAYMKIHLWLQNTFECVTFLLLYGVLEGGKTTAIDGASHLCLSMKKIMRKSCMLNATHKILIMACRPAGRWKKIIAGPWNGAEVFWCANYRLGEILQHFAFKEATRLLSDSIGH